MSSELLTDLAPTAPSYLQLTMHIGLTYDLRTDYLAAGYGEEETAEFDQLGTIEAIDGALAELGHTTDRIGHARNLVERLAHGDRWDLVFNICEGLHGRAREAQVPAILDVYEIPYTFADPAVLCRLPRQGADENGRCAPPACRRRTGTSSPSWPTSNAANCRFR